MWVKLFDEILVPCLRGLVIGLGMGFAIAMVNETKWGIFWGFVIWAVITTIQYNLRTPKKFQTTKFIQGKSQTAANNATATATNYRVKAWVEDPGKWGVAMSSPLDPDVLERIGFHLTMLNGRLSQPYLVTEWKILTKTELKNLQEALVKAEWGEYAGQQNKGGLKLKEKGESFFGGAGMRYRNLTEKEKRRFEYIYTSPTALQKLRLTRWIREKPGDVGN